MGQNPSKKFKLNNITFTTVDKFLIACTLSSFLRLLTQQQEPEPHPVQLADPDP
jgi:hypothetical protein